MIFVPLMLTVPPTVIRSLFVADKSNRSVAPLSVSVLPSASVPMFAPSWRLIACAPASSAPETFAVPVPLAESGCASR